jgi:hypothetical protein
MFKIKVIDQEFDIKEDEIINTLRVDISGLEEEYDYVCLGSGQTRNKIYEDGIDELHFVADEDPFHVLYDNMKQYDFEVEEYVFTEIPYYYAYHTEMGINVKGDYIKKDIEKFITKHSPYLELVVEQRLQSYKKV